MNSFVLVAFALAAVFALVVIARIIKKRTLSTADTFAIIAILIAIGLGIGNLNPPKRENKKRKVGAQEELLPAGVRDQVSSAIARNGCVDIYGHQESDQQFQSICNSQVPLFSLEWDGHAKAIRYDCTKFPDISIELYVNAEFSGPPVVYTCQQ